MRGSASLPAPSSHPFSGGLATPLQYVKGVGPYKADILKKLGLETVADLLWHLPRDHQDRYVVPIQQALPGAKQTVVGTVQTIDIQRAGKMLGVARAGVKDESGFLQALWYKRLSFRYDIFTPLRRNVVPGKKILLYGTPSLNEGIKQMQVDDFEIVETDEKPQRRLIPVYPLTDGITDRWLRDLMARLLPQYLPHLFDPIPASLRALQKLDPLSTSMGRYHLPSNVAERDKARERLAFDEFFSLELALALNREKRRASSKGYPCVLHKTLLTPFRQKLGYAFTKGQTRAINEIFRDMSGTMAMHRLLQGDVGSGKTVVALSAALLAIENGRQVAFLAPTEILAQQHALTLSKYLAGLPLQVNVLTASLSAAERKKSLAQIKNGMVHLVVGTHALLHEDVTFKQLGLVIIDEQHRFGVRQRARLMRQDASSPPHEWIERVQPDVLIMTATPIPRTLALTLYGDLDVSVINEMPADRAPIATRCALEEAAFQRIDDALKKNHQAYIVFPLVEESEEMTRRTGKTVRAATHELERIKERFPSAHVALLHGQMKSAEKQEAMKLFREGQARILVATPVIEVGIDVPNATVMAIINPERFGLAQLHQLRGRVGRGAHASECVLILEAGAEGNIPERLQAFCSISDGFRLAEEDLRLRGPGEILGEAQHGVPFFRVGRLTDDALLIARAREAARQVVSGELRLTLPEFEQLNQGLRQRFGNKIQLSRVG